MAKVIEIDDYRLGSQMLFQPASQEVRAYITNQVNEYVEQAKLYAPQLAQSILSSYENVIKTETSSLIKRSREMLNMVWDDESIRYLNSINAVRMASNTMRRWVIAHPGTRNRFINGGLSGWENEYKDPRPNEGTGRNHYDYRRVTNGVVVKEDDGFVRREYFEPNVKNEDVLTAMQKLLVVQTWKFLDAALSSDDNSDYTSLSNGTM